MPKGETKEGDAGGQVASYAGTLMKNVEKVVMIVGLDLAGTINTVISDNECIAVAQCNM